MDNVLIIGNGFDLNLGLKTSYRDFLASNEFKEIINDEVNTGRNYIKKHIVNKYNLEKWVDIELELTNFSKDNGSFIIQNKKDDLVFEDFKEIKQALLHYLCNIDYTIDETSLAYKLIEKFCSKNGRMPNYSFSILNFNYTNVAENLIRSLNYNADIHYIHGSLKENDIVFGVEDNADIIDEFSFLKKSCSQAFNNKNVYIEDVLETTRSIIFFGFSLGKTDHTYFKDFFINRTKELRNRKGNLEKYNLTFYYYGEKDYNYLMRQLIKLTDNNVMKLRTINNCKFIDVNTNSLDFKLEVYKTSVTY